MRIALLSAFFALAFAGAAAAQDSEASQAQDLANCAGAVAAHAGLNTITHPRGAQGQWAQVLSVILARLNVEPGVEGMTGRYAASAARAHWDEQPRAEREAMAHQCRDRFGSN